MAIKIKHPKTNTVPAWTQTDLDAAIAAGTVPPGTLLSGFVVSTDWNADHTVDATGVPDGYVIIANGGAADWAPPSAGSGTVTSVSVTTANGVSGSVANPTSTPAITLTLGAITPTTVVASGNIQGLNLVSQATIAASNTVTTTRNNLATTSVDGFIETNITAATAGVPVQYSPRLRMSGTAWNTTSSASNTSDWIIENRPVSGAAPSSNFNFGHSLNGGAFATVMTLSSGGALSGMNTINSVSTITTGGRLQATAAGINNALSLNGSLIQTNTSHFENDVATAASGTVANQATIGFGNAILTANNTGVTYTNVSTVYINGPPVASTNVTITNAYSLNVNSGNSRFGGNITATGAITAASFNGVAQPVSGSGAGTRVAFWSTSTDLSSNPNLYWDNVNNRLGVGTPVTPQALTVNGSIVQPYDDVYYAIGNNGDIGLTKKLGGPGFFACGSSGTFEIKRSSGLTIDPSNTFAPIFSIDLNGTTFTSGGFMGGGDNTGFTLGNKNLGIIKKSGDSEVIAFGSGANCRIGEWSTSNFTGSNISTGTFTEYFRVASGGAISATSLAGTGTRMVVASSTGALSTQTIPSSGTVNNFNTTKNDQTPASGSTYGTLAGSVNGSNTVFTVSNGSYVAGSLKVVLNGQDQSQGASYDFVETTPASGTFTFNVAPPTGSIVQASYVTSNTGMMTSPIRVVTASGAVSVTSADGTVIINKTTGAATAVSLATPQVGQTYIIKDGKGDANVNNITITPASGLIDGSATYVISTNRASVTIQYDGSAWWVL